MKTEMVTKKIATLLFSVAMAFTVFALPVFAAGPENENGAVLTAQQEEITFQMEDLGFDSDELFEGYVYKQFYGDYGIAMFGVAARDHLTGQNAIMYDAIAPEFAKVASGQRASTQFDVPLKALIGDKLTFTASELGVSAIVANNAITQEAQDALYGKIEVDLHSVMKSLCVDFPYESYWCGLHSRLAYPGCSAQYEGGEWSICFEDADVVTFKMEVNGDYSGAGEYTADQSKTSSAASAVETARSILTGAEGKSDYEKLEYFRDQICALASYNYDAAHNGYSNAHGNPWQLIWVFDNDPATKVVCEGYAKAFQYLCDQTSFSGDVYSYLVSGYMSASGDEPEAHMWNIVHMEDDRNYLVDVTNVDNDEEQGTEGVGRDGYKLFMKPVARGNVETYYAMECTTTDIFYQYDSDTRALYSEEELTLSKEEYDYIADMKFVAASLYLQSNLAINYKVPATLLDTGMTDLEAVFEMNGDKVTVTDYTVSDGKLVFRFSNIAPHLIGDKIYATLYGQKDGVPYESKPLEYSVATYCYNQLGQSTDAKLRTMLVDLLNYGAAAQIYKNYKTSNLVNAALTPEQKAEGSQTLDTLNNNMIAKYKTVASPEATWMAANLYLENSVTIRFKIEAADTTNMKVKITSGSDTWWIDASELEPLGDGLYYVYFNKLHAGQMRDLVYATAYRGDEAISNTVQYSVESYAANKQGDADTKLVNMINAMMKYGDAARNYATH